MCGVPFNIAVKCHMRSYYLSFLVALVMVTNNAPAGEFTWPLERKRFSYCLSKADSKNAVDMSCVDGTERIPQVPLAYSKLLDIIESLDHYATPEIVSAALSVEPTWTSREHVIKVRSGSRIISGVSRQMTWPLPKGLVGNENGCNEGPSLGGTFFDNHLHHIILVCGFNWNYTTTFSGSK